MTMLSTERVLEESFTFNHSLILILESWVSLNITLALHMSSSKYLIQSLGKEIFVSRPYLLNLEYYLTLFLKTC